MRRFTREELKEKARHDARYENERMSNLLVDPIDWEKYDNVRRHTHCHTYAIAALGDIRGQRVLDLGCGTGLFSVVLAKRGASVEGIDISSTAIATASQRALVNDVANATRFRVLSFYELDYPADYFDKVIGLSVLHHARDKRRLAAELHRVLRKGGRAVFREPFGNSAVLERLRLLVPVPVQEEDRSHWKEQVKYEDLKSFTPLFSVTYKEFQLLSRLDRIVSAEWVTLCLGVVDQWLLDKLSFLRPFARDIAVILEKA